MMAKLEGMLTGKGRVKYGSEQTSPGRGDINNFTSQDQEVVWSPLCGQAEVDAFD
jgi:hypothetical protein